MNRKIVSLLLIFVLCFTSAGAVFAEDTNMDGVLDILSELKIMQGDGNGNFRLDDTVTRAEFTKVAVAASAYRNSVPSGISVSPFPDVSYKHWSAPFVKVALSNKIVTGYTDGTFKPDKCVTYEEGLTILLQLLGYTVQDFGVSWPAGQIGLAENIELAENVNSSQGQNLTRRQVAILAYNLLGMKPKSSAGQYISTFEWSMVQDTTLVSTGSEDNSVLTSNGTYTASSDFSSDAIGREGNLFINKSGKVQYFIVNGGEASGEKYVVYSVLNDAVITYENGALSQLKLTSDTVTYVNSAKSTYSAAKTRLSMGDVLYVKRDKNGKIDYISVETSAMEGPKRVVSGESWYNDLGIENIGTVTVMRDSVKSDFSNLQTNDIAYYSKELNMIFAYTKKVTGVYEKAEPNRDMPSSVTVSGVTYELESVNAYNKLSSSGTFGYGDTVTLLMGKDGAIADVSSVDSGSSATVFGYLINSSITERDINDDGTKETVYTASIVTAGGEVSSYTVKKDYSFLKNSVVKITFNNGTANVSAVSGFKGVSGKVSASDFKIGASDVAENVKILDVATADPDGYTLYTTVYLPRIDGLEIYSDNLLYYEENAAGEIETLILKNVTGDMYKYGIVTSAPKENNGLGTYGYRIGGSTGSWNQTNRLYTLAQTAPAVGAGARFAADTTSDGSVIRVLNGECLFLISGVKEINSVYLISDANVKFDISDNVTVYKKNGTGDFMLIGLDDVLADSSLFVRAYYDNTSSGGGRVRVILVE